MSPRWTPPQTAAAAALLLGLGLQIGIPLSRLPSVFGRAEPRMQQYGWQMFATTYALPTAFAVYPDRTDSLEFQRYVVRGRGDVRYEEALPSHLCRTLSGAIAVRVKGVEEQHLVEYPCR